MRISLIVAASGNRVIGRNGELPWHLPHDFRYFKATTMGKPIVMGRHTWDSIGRALPGRHNIVLTRQPGFCASDASVATTPEQAILLAGEVDELMIIGGGEIYREFLARADRIYLTWVDTEIEGDTYFDDLPASQWRLSSTTSHARDERHAYAFEFRVYDRL